MGEVNYRLCFNKGIYETEPQKRAWFLKTFPTLGFYPQMFNVVIKGGSRAKRNDYDDSAWCQSSIDILRALESVGISVEITGYDHVEKLKGPSVIIANHMSVLETFVIPILIEPLHHMTFIVKDSLIRTPVFKHIMISRDPIVVGRSNPREDLVKVMKEGVEKLKSGTSITVFPQKTRASHFSPDEFNSIGIKLAKKADVPVIPLALKTDAWAQGAWIKDFGQIDVKKKVHFAFDAPLKIQGRGAEEHQHVIDYIGKKLKEWGALL